MAVEVIQADGPEVALNVPIAGQATVTFSSLTYNVGTNELFYFKNGVAGILGIDYTELSSNQVILLELPDAIGPDVDDLSFYTIQQGSSLFIAPPTVFSQVDMPKRPNNFSGRFVFP